MHWRRGAPPSCRSGVPRCRSVSSLLAAPSRSRAKPVQCCVDPHLALWRTGWFVEAVACRVSFVVALASTSGSGSCAVVDPSTGVMRSPGVSCSRFSNGPGTLRHLESFAGGSRDADSGIASLRGPASSQERVTGQPRPLMVSGDLAIHSPPVPGPDGLIPADRCIPEDAPAAPDQLQRSPLVKSPPRLPRRRTATACSCLTSARKSSLADHFARSRSVFGRPSRFSVLILRSGGVIRG